MAKTKSQHELEIKATDHASAVFKSINSAARALGLTLGGAAVAGAFVNAARSAIQFEQGLAKTATLLPPASRNMEQFARGLERIRLSGAGSSLGDLTEGLYQTVSAGVDAAHAVEFLGVASRAAKAGFTDTLTAVDGLTSVINAYGMSASEVEKVADIFFATQNRGKTTFGELSASIGRVLPNASSLGVSFEEIGAALQTLTAGGISTNIAVTGLNAIITGFLRAGDGAKLTTMGLAGALKDLENKTKGNQTALLEYLGGSEALTPALALMGKNAERLAENIRATGAASGTAKDAFDTYMNSAAGRIEKFRGLIEDIKTEFGRGFIDQVAKAIPPADETMKKVEPWYKLGEALGIIAVNLGKIAGYGFGWLSEAMIAAAAADEGTSYSQLKASRGMGAIPNPLVDFVGPPRVAPQMFALDEQVIILKKNAADVSTSLGKLASDLMSYWGPTISGSRFGGGRGVIEPLGRRGSQFGSGIGVRLGRIGRPLSGGLFENQFNENTVPDADIFGLDNANESLAQFQQRVQNVTSYTLSLTSSFTQALVRGIEQGTLRIKDLFNALKSAVLQILADLAARVAAAGLLSIFFPAIGFGGFLGNLTGNLFGGGSASSFRPAPVGANPRGSSFGGQGKQVIVNIYGSSPIKNVTDIERELAGRIQRGQSKLNKFL